MAKLGGTFDASGVEPNAPLEALPPGDYKVQILQSEMRVTKAGTGQMLWLDMEVLEGPLKGRHVYDQLNLINPNPTAEEIAQRTLSAICHAVGKLQVADSEELHFLPMLVRVAVKPNGYNEVKGYKPVQQAAQPSRRPRPRDQPTAPAGQPASARQPPARDRALEEERLIRKKAAPSPIEFGDTAATALSPRAFGERPWRTGR